jgi:hypothetical protein
MEATLDVGDYGLWLISATLAAPLLVLASVGIAQKFLEDRARPEAIAGFEWAWDDYWSWPKKYSSLATRLIAALLLVVVFTPLLLVLAYATALMWLSASVGMLMIVPVFVGFLVGEIWPFTIPDWVILVSLGVAYVVVVVVNGFGTVEWLGKVGRHQSW